MERCVPQDRQSEALDLICAEGFFRNLPEMPGSVEALQEMICRGYDVLICTAPFAKSRYCAQEKWEWVREHLGEEWLNRMVITADKTTVRGDVLIDDKPVITGRQQALWHQVLFDAPYNRDAIMGRRRRMMDWHDWEATLLQELALPARHCEDEDDVGDKVPTPPRQNSGLPLRKVPSVTAEDVAKLRDFSNELEGSSYLKDYKNWRKGGHQGSRGEFWQAVAGIEHIKKQMFLEGEDWCSVHVYRQDYQSWRRGDGHGAKGMPFSNTSVGSPAL